MTGVFFLYVIEEGDQLPSSNDILPRTGRRWELSLPDNYISFYFCNGLVFFKCIVDLLKLFNWIQSFLSILVFLYIFCRHLTWRLPFFPLYIYRRHAAQWHVRSQLSTASGVLWLSAILFPLWPTFLFVTLVPPSICKKIVFFWFLCLRCVLWVLSFPSLLSSLCIFQLFSCHLLIVIRSSSSVRVLSTIFSTSLNRTTS